MFKPKSQHEKIVHRLKIARGHLDKVIKMIQAREYCIDILHQSQAVQKALKETDNIILEEHLQTCAAEAIQKGEKEKAIKEVMEVFRKKD